MHAGQVRSGNKSIQQLVVMRDGEIRIPPRDALVAHGHRSPDQRLKITVPAGKPWMLVEVEVEFEQTEAPSAAARLLG
jgi:hypothetical protein